MSGVFDRDGDFGSCLPFARDVDEGEFLVVNERGRVVEWADGEEGEVSYENNFQ